MKLTKATMSAFTKHALAEFPREACGFVVQYQKGTKFIPVRNVHDTPESDFAVPGEDWAAAEDVGPILAFLHSHPQQSARLSDLDLRAQQYVKVPFGVLAVHDGVAGEFLLHPYEGASVPLLGREFTLGSLDCYGLVRDLYAASNEERAALGIVDWPLPGPVELKDFKRDAFWERDEELYLEHFHEAGFVEADSSDLRVGDGLLMMYGRKLNGEPVSVVNHSGIYIGNGMFIHHLQGQLSRREIYGGQWHEKTCKIVRYKP